MKSTYANNICIAVILFLSAISFRSFGQGKAFDVRPLLPLKYSGTISNPTAHKTSPTVVTLELNDDGTFQLSGQADNINLVGKWDLTGTEMIKNHRKILQFIGEIDFGYPGSGYPHGTVAPFTVTVRVTEEGMTGTYEIGEFPQYPNKQYGTIELTTMAKKSSR